MTLRKHTWRIVTRKKCALNTATRAPQIRSIHKMYRLSSTVFLSVSQPARLKSHRTNQTPNLSSTVARWASSVTNFSLIAVRLLRSLALTGTRSTSRITRLHKRRRKSVQRTSKPLVVQIINSRTSVRCIGISSTQPLIIMLVLYVARTECHRMPCRSGVT